MLTTRNLLIAGVLAGPIYIIVGAIEALSRTGFDLTRHSLSLLANGDLGWIHIALLVLTGVLVIAGAVGLRRVGSSRAGPILLGIFGLGLLGAGLLTPDPALGFPPGTPDGPPVAYSWHGIGHFVAGGIGFISLIAACFVLARKGGRAWAIYSVATGVVFLAGFAGIASGNQSPALNLGFGMAVVVAFTWLTIVFARAVGNTTR